MNGCAIQHYTICYVRYIVCVHFYFFLLFLISPLPTKGDHFYRTMSNVWESTVINDKIDAVWNRLRDLDLKYITPSVVKVTEPYLLTHYPLHQLTNALCIRIKSNNALQACDADHGCTLTDVGKTRHVTYADGAGG